MRRKEDVVVVADGGSAAAAAVFTLEIVPISAQYLLASVLGI